MATSTSALPSVRRKKLVTYGRTARLSSAHIFGDDAPEPEPEPEWLRKQVGRPNTSGVASETENVVGHARAEGRHGAPEDGARKRKAGVLKAADRNAQNAADEFQVPSDSEPAARFAVLSKSSRKRPVTKPADDADVFDVPSSGDEGNTAKHSKMRTAQPLRGKDNTMRHTRPLYKNQNATASSQNSRIRAKTPGATTKPTSTVAVKPTKQAAPVLKPNPRATVTLPKAVSKQKKTTIASVPSVTDAAPTPPTEPSSDFAVFDVPPSDDDVPAQTPVRPRKTPVVRTKVPPKTAASRTPLSPEASAESDVSNASQEHKLRGSASSSVTVKKNEMTQRKREASVPLQRKREASAPAQRKREASVPIQRKRETSTASRSRKQQKTDGNLSPGQRASDAPQPSLAAMVQDKPVRTRIRTAPVTMKRTMEKAQSSPVKLHGMLVVRSAAKPSPVQATPRAPILEDETMYDIPDEVTPRAQGAKPVLPGSVTPRQRDLFSNLLEESSDLTTPMPSISKLRITERTPGSGLAALTRSSSDIPQSAYTRKGRLLDMLKRAAPSSGESESEEESEADVTKVLTTVRPKADKYDTSQETDEMEVEVDVQASSQTARVAPTAEGTRTYGQQRSYLEETNPEDELLNWDDNIEIDLPTRQGSVTESEDDSQQVTGLPELRRKGQLYKFEVETQAIIEDISGKTNGSISARRSAIMEFATQLADVSYVNQLLESAMTSSLLRAVSATGDVMFDFAAAVAIVFILRTRPSYAVVEHVYQSDVLPTLSKLMSSPMCMLDIHRIAKDRKTNMSGSARESVAEFRALVLQSLDWPEADVPKLSPQLLAIKVLEELVIGLRAPGNTDAIVDDNMISKVLDVASSPAQRLQSGKATAQDDLTLETVFSALESLSVSKDGQTTWPDETLRRLADMMPAFFDTTRSSPRRLAIRLCMQLANSRPKTCEIFAAPVFVTRLARFIVDSFKTLGDKASRQPVTRMRDDLILALGAMMNLAEFSDQARLGVVHDGDALLGELVRIFLEGSERAERADSVEESHVLVPVGYLSILLGNLCLNGRVRAAVGARLPGHSIALLVVKVKEFVAYNQRVDQGAFEGQQGERALKNFTRRLMLVGERLEEVEKGV